MLHRVRHLERRAEGASEGPLDWYAQVPLTHDRITLHSTDSKALQPPCSVLTKTTSSPLLSSQSPSPSSAQSASLINTSIPGRTVSSRTKRSFRDWSSSGIVRRWLIKSAMVGLFDVVEDEVDDATGRSMMRDRLEEKIISRPPLHRDVYQ